MKRKILAALAALALTGSALATTPTPTSTNTPTSTWTVSPTPTSTATPTPTATPTGFIGNVTPDATPAGQVAVQFTGTNIQPGGTWNAYVQYGLTTSYGKLAQAGWDGGTTYYAVIPQALPVHLKPVIVVGSGTYSGSDLAVNLPTATSTPTFTITKTITQTFTITPTFTNTPSPSPSPAIATLTPALTPGGQVFVSWKITNVPTPSSGFSVYSQYGATTSYGYVAWGGWNPTGGYYFTTIPWGQGFNWKGNVLNGSALYSTSNVAIPTLTYTNSPTPTFTLTVTRTVTPTFTFSASPTFTQTPTLTATPTPG